MQKMAIVPDRMTMRDPISPPRCRFLGLLMVLIAGWCWGQNQWEDAEIETIMTDLLSRDPKFALLNERVVTPYDFGLDLFDLGKHEESLSWFYTLADVTGDNKAIYGLARILWKTGDNHGSLKQGGYVLTRNPSPVMRARTFYLMGSIEVDERDFKGANRDLEESFEIYSSLKKTGGQYLALAMMAWCAVIEGKFHKVDKLLRRARRFDEMSRNSYGPAFDYEVMAELYFRQKRYVSALNYAKKSHAENLEKGNSLEADLMLTKVALLLFLTGEPEQAGEVADGLWKKYNKRPNYARLQAYNEVLLMALDRCAGLKRDADDREKAAQAWADASAGGAALKELLDFVSAVPCPTWR